MTSRPVRRALRALATLPFVTGVQKRLHLRKLAGQPRDLDLVRRVSSRVSPRDEMYRGDLGHYLSVGLSAIRCLEAALAAAGAGDPATILDLPCGYGRVMRYLVVRFPRALITGCEIDPHALDHCAREFGAGPVSSSRDLRGLTLPASYDLIWCGSLLTHLDESRSIDLLRLLANHLNPGGILVFTTHGELVAQRIAADPASYRLALADRDRVLARRRDTGHTYWDHPDRPDHGVSISSDAWVRASVARLASPLHELFFRPRGWDDHQDVFAYRRS